MRDKSIHGLDDFRLSLGDLRSIVEDLIDEHGADTIVYTDAGHNNVSIMLQEPVPKKTRLAQAVESLKATARKAQKKAESSNGPGGLNMQGMYLKDAGDYLRIAGLIKEDRIKDAAHKAFRLDTAARDEIPQDVWALFEPYRNS